MNWIKRLFSKKKVETKQCDIHVVSKSCGYCKTELWECEIKQEHCYTCGCMI